MRRRHRIGGNLPAPALSAAFWRVGRPASGLLAGLVLVAAFPTTVAQQDAASLLLKSLDPATRWTMAIAPGPGGITEIATPALQEVGGSAMISAGPNGERIVLEGVSPAGHGAADPATWLPDEDRIDRSWKGDLPGTFTTPSTRRGFSAGSIYEEHSRLQPPGPDTLPTVAFSAASAPLSALAVARFIQPRDVRATAVADLSPAPVPLSRPDQTRLVAAHYPPRPLAPAANVTAEAVLAAYAPDTSVVAQDMFDALFARPREKPPVPPRALAPGDHWWGALPLPATAFDPAEEKCLAEAVYFEARGEPVKGQTAVAQVVLNRVRNPAYPDRICDVVYQNEGRKDACQFSFACDGIKDVVRPGRAWTVAKTVAHDVLFGGVWLDEVGTSTHYHATYVRPNWADVFRKQSKIGRHVFYQTIHGGWS
ncbi:cell wall hydrolase [Chthonobacter rhizosphaerae]|uniref:cell wall hydrolase n=1 Tax=Chthonobacter rhizosphaerae TaxID=2735553 RepID=UPI0015EEB4E3|nr:cell wall hydrolase [Chthonobacter rhizosphaerae]